MIPVIASPATLSLILQGITAVITAAPQIAELVKSCKDLIAALGTAKIINKETQDALVLYVDARAALARVGLRPDYWVVEANPPTPGN